MGNDFTLTADEEKCDKSYTESGGNYMFSGDLSPQSLGHAAHDDKILTAAQAFL